MKRIFDIKRTKMIDEAAFGHAPASFARAFLAFFIVYIISNFASNLVSTLPLAIYSFAVAMKNGAYEVFESAVENGDMEAAYAFLDGIIESIPWWAFLLQLFAYGFMIFASIFYCKKFEKRSVSSMGLRKNGVALEIALGLLFGGALIIINYLLTGMQGAVGYEFNGFNPLILLFIPAFFVLALGEELLARGFFMTSLARDYSPWLCIITSSLVISLFSLSYTSIVGFINTLLLNIMLGILAFKRGSIWCGVIIKLIWGFVGANILGTSVFGYTKMLSIFTPVYTSGGTFTTGGEIGFIGGIFTTVILVCIIFILLLTRTKKGEESAVKIEYFG